MKSYIFRVEIEEEDGTWSAVVPALPGCAVDAGTPEEALEAIEDVAQIYIESLLEDGLPIPSDQIESNVVDGPAIAIVA
jgi:predicted RNase H-like HicB family nuclease